MTHHMDCEIGILRDASDIEEVRDILTSLGILDANLMLTPARIQISGKNISLKEIADRISFDCEIRWVCIDESVEGITYVRRGGVEEIRTKIKDYCKECGFPKILTHGLWLYPTCEGCG